MTPLFGMAALSPVLPPDVIKKTFVPVLTSLAADTVPNIRMNVAKTITGMQSIVKGTGELEVN
jgi:hypothetical protein